MKKTVRSHQPAYEVEFERLRRRLRLALGALVLVTAVGVLGFVLIGHGTHSAIDAIYMTVITLTTVGFGEIIDMSQSPGGRVFTMLLLLVGMGVVAYTVPMFAAFLIEGQLHHIFARRRMQNKIAELSDHFIVCGDTAASWHVAEELIRTKRDVVIVAPTDADIEEARQWLGDFAGVTGDPTSEDVLRTAGAERAAGLVFSMESDKDNVIGVLSARRLAPNARIVGATEQPETEAKLRSVGADAVVSPSRIGGLRMASELVRPTVVTFLDKMLREKGGTLRVEEISVPQESAVTDRSLADLHINEMPGVLLVALRQPDTGAFDFKPDTATALRPGMTLVVMTDADGLHRLKSRFRSATGTHFRLRDSE